MKRNLPLIVAGTATMLASLGVAAQAASAAPVAQGQSWKAPTVQGQSWKGQSWKTLPEAANKWRTTTAPAPSLLTGGLRLISYGTGPVMPPKYFAGAVSEGFGGYTPWQIPVNIHYFNPCGYQYGFVC